VRLTPDSDHSRALFGVSGRTPCDKQLSGVIKSRSIMMVIRTSITEKATKAKLHADVQRQKKAKKVHF